MAEEKPTIGELLDEIIQKEGAYSHDHLQHAENVIDNASKNAKEVKARLIEAIDSLIDEAEGDSTDILQGLYAFLNSCGAFKTDSEKK